MSILICFWILCKLWICNLYTVLDSVLPRSNMLFLAFLVVCCVTYHFNRVSQLYSRFAVCNDYKFKFSCWSWVIQFATRVSALIVERVSLSLMLIGLFENRIWWLKFKNNSWLNKYLAHLFIILSTKYTHYCDRDGEQPTSQSSNRIAEYPSS